MSKLSVKPAYCVSCYGQPEGRYVDFEAAYDGPVIPGAPEPMPVEDLVICEACLTEAFILLDPNGEREENVRLRAELETALKDNDTKDKIITGLREGVNELAESRVKVPRGRPKPAGVSKEAADELKELRRRKATKKKKAKVAS